MNEDDMAEVVAAHVLTARHLREAGLDGLEVHFGHGHLLQQFLSPASNVRTDAYGGSEENRLRFPLAVLQAVREAMGPDFPVGIRISAEEFMAPGLGLEDMQRMVPRIAAAVPIHFVNVSHSAYIAHYSLATQMADMHFPRAAFRYLPAGIKAVVPHLPVFAVCRFNRLELAEEVLAAGEADLVGMARAHIADPFLLAKARAGRLGVTIECGVEATVDRVLAFRPDAVVLATGARPKLLVIPGAAHVFSTWEALLKPAALGHHVAFIEADGNWQSVATAEHLAELGKRVTLITGGVAYGARITIYSMLAVQPRLREKKVRVMPLRAVRAVEGRAVVLEDLSTGEPDRLDGVDSIVAAVGGVAEDRLAHELRGHVPELRMVGDCVAPRTALEAIFEGHAVGRAV